MNLARHAAVLWRFRAVTATGLVLGILLAILGSYRVTINGGVSLVARGTSVYGSESQVLVTQPGFPEGRVTLPPSPVLGSTTDPKTEVDPNRIEFAAPERFMALADLYTQLITSDRVRIRIPGHPKADQITASPLPAVSGAPILPIIALTTRASTATGAHALNTNSVDALRAVLTEEQRRNGIQPAHRVELTMLKAPSAGALVAGPSRTASILALLLCLIGTVAVTHLLAGLRDRTPEESIDGIVDWARDTPDVEPDEPEADLGRRRLAAFAAPGRRRAE
jgi:hypothetical protein